MSASDSDIQPSDPVEAVDGIGPSRGDTLRENGYTTVSDLQEATVGELAQILPAHVAQSIKAIVGDIRSGDALRNIPTASEAKRRARQIPGAKAKVVKRDGKQVGKVLKKDQEQNLGGATMTIHKG